MDSHEIDWSQTPCLTVRQPWAHLIAIGEKRIENRTWATKYRGLIGIHAGKSLKHVPIEERDRYAFGAIIAVVELVDIVAQSTDPYFQGPLGWVLRGARRLEPIPVRGGQRLFLAAPGATARESRS